MEKTAEERLFELTREIHSEINHLYAKAVYSPENLDHDKLEMLKQQFYTALKWYKEEKI